MAKFKKEEALAACKAKFTNSEGKSSLKLSDRTLTETLEALYDLVGDEMELNVFVDKHFFPGIDSANRNYIKGQSDDAKAHEQALEEMRKKYEDGKGGGFDMEEFKKVLLETNQNAINEAINPLKEEIAGFRKKETLSSRTSSINLKRDALKLSSSQLVDFDNSVELACAVLGEEATADEVYNKAYEHFIETLGKRGEKYEPKEGSGGHSTEDFSEIKGILDKRKKQQDEMNKV